MYRDRSTTLDEHDRAVGSIQIADGLIAGCLAAAKRIGGPGDDGRWRIAGAIADDYLEIWRQLDTARRILVTRGMNTHTYDELRREVAPVLALDDDPRSKQPLDLAPFDDARRALEELRLAMPGADWTAIAKRTIELVNDAPIAQRGQRVKLGVVVSGFALGVVTWAAAMKAEKAEDPDVAMRKEIAGLVQERKHRIDELQVVVGQRCDRFRVQELMKLYVMDGRWEDARWFGDSYELRCGADPIVHKWATAPRPHHHDE